MATSEKHSSKPFHITPFGLLFAAVVTLLTFQPTLAKEYHVIQAGRGDFTSVQDAANVAQRPGDIVTIHAGTYQPFIIRHSGAPDQYIWFRAAPGAKPVIEGKVPPITEANVQINASTGQTDPIGWIKLYGLEIANSPNDGIKAYNIHHWILMNCHIHHSSGQNILVISSHDVTIDGNTISDCGQSPQAQTNNQVHGLYATGRNWTVTHNSFRANSAYGIQIAGYSIQDQPMWKGKPLVLPGFDTVDNWMVADNTFERQKNCAGIVVWPGYTGSCNKVTITRNVFTCNAENVYAAFSSPNGVLIYGSRCTNIDIRDNVYSGEKPFFANPADPKLVNTHHLSNNTNADLPVNTKAQR